MGPEIEPPADTFSFKCGRLEMMPSIDHASMVNHGMYSPFSYLNGDLQC